LSDRATLLTEALIRQHIAHKTQNAKGMVKAREEIQEILHAGMQERIGRAVAEMRKARKLGDFLNEREKEVDESLGDVAHALGHAALHVAGHAAADSLGIKPGAFKKLGTAIRAIKKKRTFDVSKAKKTAPVKHAAGAAPAKMDRADFNKSIKQAGGDLRKLK
jgi:hypothetical protein